MASGKSSILLLFVLRFLVGVGAYAIDDSCKSHATDQQDKTDIIKSAMSAARNMAVDAANTIIMNNHLGNARDQLFKDSTPNHWYQIQGMILPMIHIYEIQFFTLFLMFARGIEERSDLTICFRR